MRTAVITINWNKYDLTEILLQSLKKSNYHVDVFVGDNESDQELAKKHLSMNCKKIYYFENNTGYAYPNNLIAKDISKDYELLLFINNDCEVTVSAIQELVNAYTNSKSKTIFQPLLMNYDDRTTVQSAGFMSVLGSKYGGFRYESRKLSTVSDKLSPIMKEELLYGACFLISSKDFVEAGGFDESLYYQLEDVELGKRLQEQQGYDFKVVTDAVVYHKSHGSESLRGPRHIYYWTRNYLKFVADNHAISRPLSVVVPLSILFLWLPSRYSKSLMAVKNAITDFKVNKFNRSEEYK